MIRRTRITPEAKAYARVLRTETDKTLREVANLCGISAASVLRITRRDIRIEEAKNVRSVGGRPRKLSGRQQRQLLRAIGTLRKSNANFTALELMVDCGLAESDISVRSIQRFMNQHGYKYLQARKKGLLKSTDLKKRVTFARGIKNRHADNFWKRDIMFYFDGSSFAHKRNPMEQATAPRGRVWRKKSEGLTFGCTAKGKKVGSGGNVLRLFVAISYGKGVVLAKAYKKLNASKFCRFVRRYFPRTVQASGSDKKKTFLQDGDPSQNSVAAKSVFDEMGLQVFTIPPRSPDLNPIENVFNIVGSMLRKDAVKKRIEVETFVQFKKRVIRSLKSIPTPMIDNIITSMPKRLDLIISNGGQRLRY